jgi:hypothetical protein
MASAITAPQVAAPERNNIITPWVDFLDRPVLDAAKQGQANADALSNSRQFLRIRANTGDGTVVGTKVVLAQVFLVLTD